MPETNKIIQFHTLLHKVGIMDQKEAILEGFGVTSSKDLSDLQITEVISRLQRMSDARYNVPESTRRKRSTILDLLVRLDVYKNNGDWSRVNKYLMQPRIAGKLLYEMDETELDALARKLRAILKKQEEKIQEENYWAANN